MSKAHDILDAEFEALETNAWKCRTCERPTHREGSPFCLHCELYWQDCDAGMFDDDWGLAWTRALEVF